MTTLGGVVQDGASRLELGAHPERAKRDAEMLLLHALGKDRAWLMTHSTEEPPDTEAAHYGALLERRLLGEPIQYITGEQEFYGLRFRVSPDVLIPRPETEHLVEKALALAGGFERPRIVDVGAGSGAIAVALAHKLPEARIAAVDISIAALNVARGNAERNGLAGRVQFVQSDLLEGVAGERFELVVSNPPYVPTMDRGSLSIEVREHEPALALFAGADGLDVYRRLIPAAFSALEARGYVALEIGYGQSNAVAALLANSGFRQIEFLPDLQGIARIACAQRMQSH